MGFIRTFCCCCNVRTGSVVCALYSLVTSVVYMALVFIRYTDLDAGKVHDGVMFSTLAVFGLESIISIGLLVAVHTDRRILYIPYITETLICIIHGIVCNVCIMQVHLEKDLEIGSIELTILTYHIVNTIISGYCILCVSSQLHDLIHGKGTKDYYRRMDERQRRVMEFILSMQMFQELDCPDVPIPLPVDGVDNAAFTHQGAPLPPGGFPPPPPAGRPGSPAPPPPYDASAPYSPLDRPPEYSTLPRIVQGHGLPAQGHTQGQGQFPAAREVPGCRGQGSRRNRNGGMAQGIMQSRGRRQEGEMRGRGSGPGTSQIHAGCPPPYTAPSMGRSWNSRMTSSPASSARNSDLTSGSHHSNVSQSDATSRSSRNHGNHDGVVLRPDVDLDACSDISSVSSPTRGSMMPTLV